ncbi:hypothetical protein Fot_56956 [Forsythia ovata]|uniref:Uncharacterized protein n=1 Tax=Forsythia ovata TaxID=205694 RepID=A0ABD1NXE1_9LAMI
MVAQKKAAKCLDETKVDWTSIIYVTQEEQVFLSWNLRVGIAHYHRLTVIAEGKELLGTSSVKKKVPKAKPPHLCQRPLDQTGCKSRDVYEWQGLEGESQHANPQDRPSQYFSENLPHTVIEPALPEDFSPRHLKSYQLSYAPGRIVVDTFVLNIEGP